MIPDVIFERTLMEFFAPIKSLLEDQSVSEVMINGSKDIRIEKCGRIEKTEAAFESDFTLEAALRNLAQYTGRKLDVSSPILEGRLPDGSRVEALIPPVAPDGPQVSIRRFSKSVLSMSSLVGKSTLTMEAADFLRRAVAGKKNVIVAGGTGSGKTSFLNALSGFIPEGARIVTIEDARELNLQHDHVVALEARPCTATNGNPISVRDLFRASLRMRPDRVVVGEIRGGEALDLLQAMTSGHGGCLSTLHATYPRDVLSRLETMALMSDVELPLDALRSQIGSAVDLIVLVARFDDGTRCVTHITRVDEYQLGKGYTMEDVFSRYEGDLVCKRQGGKGKA